MDLRTHAAVAYRAAEKHRSAIAFPKLPSPEILFTLFVLGTVLTISPVGQHIDRFFDLEPITRRDDGSLYTFLSEGLDRISSQRVVGVLLLITGLAFSWMRRSLAPLLIVGLAELMFLATGVVKVLIGKNSTKIGTPEYWTDGLLEHGKHSMAYPSGHAMESVTLFGVILLLLVMYAPGWTRHHTIIGMQVWNVAMIQTVVVSWLLGRHWISDLAGGLVWGMLTLTLVVGLVERGYPQALAAWVEEQYARARLATADQERRPTAAPARPDAGLPPLR